MKNKINIINIIFVNCDPNTGSALFGFLVSETFPKPVWTFSRKESDTEFVSILPSFEYPLTGVLS